MIRSGVLFGATAGAFWGLVFLSPLLLTSFSALEIATGRFLVYGTLSLLFIIPSIRWLWQQLTLKNLGLLLALGILGNVLFFSLLAGSIQQVGIGPASLVVGMAPVVITLLGRLDKDSLPLSTLSGPLFFIVAGILLINADALMTANQESQPLSQSILGLLMAFGALISWSLFTILNAQALKRQTEISSTLWSYLTGVSAGLWALGLAVILWSGQIFFAAPETSLDEKDWSLFWIVCLGVGFGGSLIANIFWNSASRRLPLSLTGQVFVFEPIFALLYGFFYVTRLPRPLESMAIILLISGVLWAMRTYQKKAAPSLTQV